MWRQTPRQGQGTQRNNIDVFQPLLLIFLPFSPVFSSKFHQNLHFGCQRELGVRLFKQESLFSTMVIFSRMNKVTSNSEFQVEVKLRAARHTKHLLGAEAYTTAKSHEQIINEIYLYPSSPQHCMYQSSKRSPRDEKRPEIQSNLS